MLYRVLLLLLVMTALSLAVGCTSPLASRPHAVPVILDTDIGGDIDDAWALTFLLASPELDVKLVVSNLQDTRRKADLIAQFLQRAGRTDIPIGIGHDGREDTGGPYPALDGYPGRVYADGVEALIDTIMRSPERITLIGIGPVPNLALALEREPRIVEKARLIVMGGCIGSQEQGGPGFREYNVGKDPKAARQVYAAGWDVTMAPIDTAGKIQLDGDDYARVRNAGTPMTELLMQQYDLWNQRQTRHAQDVARRSSILWDTVAIYLAFDESLCRIREIPLTVTDDGITKPTPGGKLTRVAIAWKDLPAFHKLLADRIAGLQPATTR